MTLLISQKATKEDEEIAYVPWKGKSDGDVAFLYTLASHGFFLGAFRAQET